GDVAARPNGDGSVTTTDVIQLRRFAAQLDIPAPGNEKQRADCAPFSTFGDGNVTSADVIQGRRFAATLDPLTPTGGPLRPGVIASLIDDVYAYFFGREIKVGSAKTDGGQVTVPVELTPNGDEMAAGFTLEYDASRLSNPRIVLGDAGGEGSILTVNTNEPGRIGIIVDGDQPMAASSTPKSIVIVTFDLMTDTDGPTSITLTDSLAMRSVANINGDPISVQFKNSDVQIAR
ncbi:MAG: cohesin domain-containing protein, partial [Pyrinomonadaceae bacterium]